MGLSSLAARARSPVDPTRYERLRVVGSGAFGVVHEALDRVTQRRVAMKELVRLDPAALQRFKLEFRAFVDLDHPHVVRVHALVAEAGRWFVVMDFVDGVDLLTAFRGTTSTTPSPATYVSLDGDPAPAVPASATRAGPAATAAPSPADDARLRRLFRELASAVLALHAAGRLHRDIKPSNVLVDHLDRVVLVDFGLATELARAAIGMRLQGTPAYMSPEQAERARLTPASDWYAFGVVLYQMLTGALPFSWDSGSPPSEARAAMQARDPRELAPGCAPDLAELALALLAVDPEQRPKGSEVLAHLWRPTRNGSDGELETFAGATPELIVPFVGRAGALAQLVAALARSRAGAVHVRIEAPSGVGKSTLVAQLEAQISGSALMLRGRAFEREAIPLKSVDPLVDALASYLQTLSPDERAALEPPHAAELALMFPVLAGAFRETGETDPAVAARGAPQESQRRALVAFRELIARLARSPLVLVLDDAQWGDAEGARVLGSALAAPVLLLTTCRSDHLDAPFHAALAEAAPDVPCERLELAPLSELEARGLAATLMHGDAVAGERVAAESGGHPFFLVELARRSLRAGNPNAQSEVISLDAVLIERVRRLPRDAQALVEALALTTHALPLEVLAEICGTSPGALEEGLRTLFAERVVRRRVGSDDVERIECAHDRVRESIAGDLTSAAQLALHARLAGAFERHEASAHEAIATHWQRAGDVARASPHFAAAARRAIETLAFGHAADLFTSALAGADATQRPGLAVARAEALSLAGRDLDAARAFELALTLAPSEAERLEYRRAETYLRAGHLEEGLGALRPVLARVGERLPRTVVGAIANVVIEDIRLRSRGVRTTLVAERDVPAAVLARIDANWVACQGLANVDIVRGVAFIYRQLRLALAAGERRRLARGLGMNAMMQAGLGQRHLARAERYARLATELASVPDPSDGRSDPYGSVWASIGRAMISLGALDWPSAHRGIEDVLATIVADSRGLAWELGMFQYFAALVRQTVGDLRGVLDDVPRWAADAERRGDRYTRTMLGVTFLPWCELCKDRPERAIEGIHETIQRWPSERFMMPHLNAVGLEADALLYAGRAQEALALLVAASGRIRKARLMTLEIVSHRVDELVLRATSHVLASGQRCDTGPAKKSIARLRKRNHPWTDALALAATPGFEGADPRVALPRAEASFREAGQHLMGDLAAFARERDPTLRGRLVAGGIVAPERFAAMYFPGT